MKTRAWTALTVGAAAAIALPWWSRRRRHRTSEASASWIVERPPGEVWSRWRRLDDLPRFLRHVDSVEVLDDVRSRWTAVGPGGRRVEWEAEIVEEVPGRRLAWCSSPGSEVRHAGEIEVLPVAGGDGEQASVVRASVRIGRGNGLAGRVARIEPLTRRALAEDLRRFKSLMEAGEVPRTGGQPTGRRPAVDPTNPF